MAPDGVETGYRRTPRKTFAGDGQYPCDVRIRTRRNHSNFDDMTYNAMADGIEKLVAYGIDIEEATKIAVEAYVCTTDSVAPTVASTLKRTAPQMLRQRLRRGRIFRRVLQKYWGQALNLYLSICVCAEEAGRDFDDRNAEEAAERRDYLFEALTGLHARACRIALEIHHLLAGGFPMGALARCRTLHEIAVVMTVLADFGRMGKHADLAERFLLHDEIQNWTDAETYQESCEALGSEPFTEDEMTEMEQRRAELLRRFGASYRYDYGWAVGLDDLKKPDFRDLERLANVSYLRSYYRWASHEVHADSKGWGFNVFQYGDLLYKETGPMHFDLAEPACLALTSLRQCLIALLLSTDELSPGYLLALKAAEHLTNDTINVFNSVEQAVEKMDEQLLSYPPRIRYLGLCWLLLRPH